jgi:pilus assembly protein CpaF
VSVSPTVWAQIRAGRAPTLGLVARVLDGEAVVLGETGALRARSELAAQVLGAGPLEPLLADPQVTDVLVNAGSGVWVDRGDGLTRADCEVGDEEAVRRLAVRLAGIAGRRLDDTSPYVDGLLPGGVRLHAVLPPIAVEGSHISLRVPRQVAPSLVELARWGMFGQGWLRVLEALVRRRCSFVVTGGTGSGKTTLLGALLGEVDVRERLVIVEDVRELAIVHPHVVRLQSRPANVEGRGEIGLTSLVRQSLRMRPDRLVVGEVRGAEVREMLAALNTGHEGGCGTLHANTAADVVARFEALGALAGLGPSAVHAQLLSAVQVVVHLRRSSGRRFLDTVAVLVRGSDGRPEVRSALCRGADGETAVGPAWRVLAALLDLAESPEPAEYPESLESPESVEFRESPEPVVSPESPESPEPVVSAESPESPDREPGIAL